MSNVIYHKVLVLNRGWQPIGTCTVKKALEDMHSLKSPKLAFKIEYSKNENNEYDFNSPIEMIPLKWDLWEQLSPRDFDTDVIRTPSMVIRTPTVIICPSYDKMPLKTFRATKKNIYEKYNGICAYTGKKLSYKEATLDHILPKSRGGKNDWNNMVISDGEINRKKSNKTPEEAGLKLLYKTQQPKPVPASLIIRSIISPDWAYFLKID